MLLATPLSLAVMTSRLPLAEPSLMMFAVTPAPAALIASRTPASVPLDAGIAIVTGVFAPFVVKVLPVLS